MNFWQDNRILVTVFVLAAVLASLGKYCKPTRMVNGTPITQYNNYLIFKNSALHLAQGKNLYGSWRQEQFDEFKYSPTFSAFMWPLATLPDWLGLCLWNIAGALAILYAMRSLPLPPAATALAAWLVFKDSLTSLQNAQSNGLVAALMILTVVCWEKQRPLGAGLMLALSLYLKIFGIGVLLLWVLYPQKLKTVVGGVIAAVALFFLPLALTPFDLLIQQYQNWLQMLGAEFPTSEGISVMGMLHAWFGISGYKSLTILMGGMILAAPLLRFKQYEKQSFRLGMLASVLMWVVLFNHRAESPTFVIATAGVAIWFVSRPVTRLNIGLMLFTLLLSGFSSSEIMPAWLQKNVLEPYQLKALPCLLVWLKLQTELWRKPATLAGAQTNLAASTPPVSYQLRAA